MTAPAEVDIGTLIERKPGVYGGRHVLKGTRFPVSLIGVLHQQGMTAEDIKREWEYLDPVLIHAGLAFYLANRTYFDELILEDEREYNRLAEEHRPFEPKPKQ